MNVTINLYELCNYIRKRFTLLNVTENKVLAYLKENGIDISNDIISIDFDKLDAILNVLDRQQRRDYGIRQFKKGRYKDYDKSGNI
mgnify:CR=1 FL=1